MSTVKTKLELLIAAKDEATNVLKGVGSALSTGVGAAAGLAMAGVSQLGDLLRTSVDAAMESQEVQAQLASVLKSTGGVAGMTADSVNELASSLMGVTRFEDDAIVAGENLLLTFTNIGKDVFPDATEIMLDMSTAMGTDLKSSAIQLGKALNDPLDGLSALSRVGVSFTDEQERQIKALMGGNAELEKLGKEAAKAQGTLPGLERDLAAATLKLTEMKEGGKASASALLAQENKVTSLQEKISSANGTIADFSAAQAAASSGLDQSGKLLAAQNIILGELQKEFGGAAQAAGATFAGQMDILNNQLGDVKENIGNALLPVLSSLVTEYGPQLVEFAQEAGAWFASDLIPALVDVATWIGDNVIPAVVDLVGWLVENLGPIIQDLAQWIGDELVPALEDVFQWMGVNLPPVIDKIKGAFEGIGNAISGVIGWIGNLIDKFKGIKLPDWLTPGSPTPFEIGLVGIADAMRQLSAVELPKLNAELQINQPALPAFGVGGGASAAGRSVYVAGDTYHMLVQDRASASLLAGLIADNKRTRLNQFMGAM